MSLRESATNLGSWAIARGIEQGVALFKDWLGNIGLPEDPSLAVADIPYTIRLYKDLLWFFANLFGIRVYIGSGHKVYAQLNDMLIQLQSLETQYATAESRLDELSAELSSLSQSKDDEKRRASILAEAKTLAIVIGSSRFRDWLNSKSDSVATEIQNLKDSIEDEEIKTFLNQYHLVPTNLKDDEKTKFYNDVRQNGIFSSAIEELCKQVEIQSNSLKNKLSGTLVFSTIPLDFAYPENWSKIGTAGMSPYKLISELKIDQEKSLAVVPIWQLDEISEISRSSSAKSQWAFDLSQILDPQVLYMVQLIGKQFDIPHILKFAKGLINPDQRLEGKTYKPCNEYTYNADYIIYKIDSIKYGAYQASGIKEYKNIYLGGAIHVGPKGFTVTQQNPDEILMKFEANSVYLVETTASDIFSKIKGVYSDKWESATVIRDECSYSVKIGKEAEDKESLQLRSAVSRFIDRLAGYIQNPWALYGIKGPGVWTGSDLDELNLSFTLHILGLRVIDTKDPLSQSAAAIAAENLLEKAKAKPFHVYVSSNTTAPITRKDYSDLVKRVIYNTVILPMYQIMKQNMWGNSYKVEFIAWGRPIYSAIGFGDFELSQNFDTSLGETPVKFQLRIRLRDATYGVIREFPHDLSSSWKSTDEGVERLKEAANEAIQLSGAKFSSEATGRLSSLRR